MAEEQTGSPRESQAKRNRFHPGLGLTVMGLFYLVWWLVNVNYAIEDPRWTHNYIYAIIILVVGLSWYHESPLSRFLALIVATMLPITAIGTFNTVFLLWLTIILSAVFGLVLLVERRSKKTLLESRLSKRARLWINLHAMVLAWLNIAHMAIIFLVGRVPIENQLLAFGDILGENVGFLVNLPSEVGDYATWFYDLGLIVWVLVIIYEQVKMGYNLNKKPWPRLGFIWTVVIMALGILGVLFNELIILI